MPIVPRPISIGMGRGIVLRQKGRKEYTPLT